MSKQCMTNGEWLSNIAERLCHSDTMRHPDALELTWYRDAQQHMKSLTPEERIVWLDTLIN